MLWQQLPYTLILVMLAFACLLVALSVWRLGVRQSRGSAGLLMSAAVWLLAYAMELASPDLPTKLLWNRIQFLGIVTAPLALLHFALDQIEEGHRLTWRVVICASLVPLITLVLVFTNDMHGLIWRRSWLYVVQGVASAEHVRGHWFFVHLIYSYAIAVFSVVMLTRWIYRHPDGHADCRVLCALRRQ